jgi:hypothetical protein
VFHLAFAVLAAAACTRDAAPPPQRQTVSTSSSTSLPPTTDPKPQPHSPLADVDLPADVAFLGNSSIEERWGYSAPFNDTVVYLRKQFATGRRYDADGATWWRDLPPCYNTRHESPPGGWDLEESVQWMWADANTTLSVEVLSPSSTITPNQIVVNYLRRDYSSVCNRQ